MLVKLKKQLFGDADWIFFVLNLELFFSVLYSDAIGLSIEMPRNALYFVVHDIVFVTLPFTANFVSC